MREALRDSPDVERPIPAGIVNVRIDPDTGLLAYSGQKNAIFEYFRAERVPQRGGQENGPGSGNKGTDDLVDELF